MSSGFWGLRLQVVVNVLVLYHDPPLLRLGI